MTKKKEFFEVSAVSRTDIISLLQDNRVKATEKEVNALTDEEMEDIAENMGEMFTESGAYWDYLESLTKEILKEKKGEKK